ncbi:MAG TPA: hypothetical protein VLH79_07045 [Chthonomonadales bacterium]|nr:hypothetical protein [Chthonomonadales bacterium]
MFEWLDRRVGPGARRLAGSHAVLRVLKRLLMGSVVEPAMCSGTIAFERHSFQFRAPRRVFAHARRSGIEATICRTLMAHCRPGDTAIDVGANAGFVTLVLGLSVGSRGRVLSFEPDTMWGGWPSITSARTV